MKVETHGKCCLFCYHPWAGSVSEGATSASSTEQHLTATRGEALCKNCLAESINLQPLEIMIQYGVHTIELEQSLF